MIVVFFVITFTPINSFVINLAFLQARIITSLHYIDFMVKMTINIAIIIIIPIIAAFFAILKIHVAILLQIRILNFTVSFGQILALKTILFG